MSFDDSVDPPVPPVDPTVAHTARVWNYWLGGKDNYEIDRIVGKEIARRLPGIGVTARADRVFLQRLVRYLAGGAGITQFLDIGTGLPSADNTHQVAQRLNLAARVEALAAVGVR